MSRKKTTNSEDADTIIRRHGEGQDPAQQSIRNEFEGAESVLNEEPGEQLIQERTQHPQAILSGGDLDAHSENGDSGEETVSGSHPTPDQDNVDELGEATGLTFEDSEQLGGEKVFDRDIHRWDLDPASSEDYEERIKNYRK